MVLLWLSGTRYSRRIVMSSGAAAAAEYARLGMRGCVAVHLASTTAAISTNAMIHTKPPPAAHIVVPNCCARLAQRAVSLLRHVDDFPHRGMHFRAVVV